jgi:hypothetical protein
LLLALVLPHSLKEFSTWGRVTQADSNRPRLAVEAGMIDLRFLERTFSHHPPRANKATMSKPADRVLGGHGFVRHH